MDSQEDYGDPPFCSESMLQEPMELHGLSRDDCFVTCHVSQVAYRFPTPYLAFIELLSLVNTEITSSWENEDQEDQVYWISLRTYLNKVLQSTLMSLREKRHPMALTCWLHREFLLCRHDGAGRREYLALMKGKKIAPYSVNIFELGKFFSECVCVSAQ